jgi:hypothetical protein
LSEAVRLFGRFIVILFAFAIASIVAAFVLTLGYSRLIGTMPSTVA